MWAAKPRHGHADASSEALPGWSWSVNEDINAKSVCQWFLMVGLNDPATNTGQHALPLVQPQLPLGPLDPQVPQTVRAQARC